jgi:uncharacterized protein with GYD domain
VSGYVRPARTGHIGHAVSGYRRVGRARSIAGFIDPGGIINRPDDEADRRPQSRVGPGIEWRGSDTVHPRRVFMITQIALMNFTDKGLQSVRDSTKRAVAAKEVARKFGVNMREIYWTQGEYDIVCVLEADDEQAIAAFALANAAQGNVRAKSLRAFSAGEMDRILSKLP